ncbi:MAG TPA: chemotaxis protein CheA [Spirochaetota bacterium]|nr:chemotaxis protein CheA [Spirochaetota bacterium]HPS87923.1 chemotaxis protein CheA [Spirochaetota bacterium]
MEIESIKEIFKEEAYELLAQIDHPLMELEKTPDNPELVNTIFRTLHTIKGSGSMCGFDELARFTHDLESIFDCMRKGLFKADHKIIGLTLKAKDCMRSLLDGSNSIDDSNLRNEILEELKTVTEGRSCADMDEPEQAEEGKKTGPAETASHAEEHYKIIFMPAPDIFLRTMKIEPLLHELSALGRYSVRIDAGSIPDFDEMDAERCYVNWIIDLYTDKGIGAIRNVFIFAEDYSELIIKTSNGFYVNNAFFLKEDVAVPKEIIQPRGSGLPSRRAGDGIIADRRKVDATSIRVKNEKLDTLVNVVGELVTLQARLNQESVKVRMPEFISIAEQLGRLTDELRDSTMSIRMVPLADTFNGFQRLIYDLSGALNKKMKVITSGGETELDKNVMEGLRDPLMHLIRNSADHGIESPAVRREAGKDETGTISLLAEYAGSNVKISIADDGAGLNREKIRNRAIEKNLLGTGEYDDRQIFSMIFEPGFSTAEVTTDISGRGVGMDVVKRNIEKLRGCIDIESSDGKGTTVVLTIPLTLAIIDGFMVELGGGLFILNLSNVRECLDFSNVSRDDGDGQFVINLRGDIIPCIDLRTVFKMKPDNTEYPHIVITEIDSIRYGFLVDKVMGKYQTVVKPLAKGSHNRDMIAGATILGDGSVALILDAASIVKDMISSAEGNKSNYYQ